MASIVFGESRQLVTWPVPCSLSLTPPRLGLAPSATVPLWSALRKSRQTMQCDALRVVVLMTSWAACKPCLFKATPRDWRLI